MLLGCHKLRLIFSSIRYVNVGRRPGYVGQVLLGNGWRDSVNGSIKWLKTTSRDVFAKKNCCHIYGCSAIHIYGIVLLTLL